MIRKDNILLLGIGEAGNKLVGEISSRSKRYVSLYINTSYKDILKVQNAKNIYVVPNADGTGRNRSKAKQYFVESATSILDTIDRFPMQEHIFITFSLGGGTGSGMATALIQLLSKYRKNKKISIIGILPRLDESEQSKINTIECWNELIKLNNIDLSFFIDNNKRATLTEINTEFADRFDAMLNMSEFDIENIDKLQKNKDLVTIDESDMDILLSKKGSVSIYMLPTNGNDAKVAVAKAIDNNIFADFSKDECKSVAVSLLYDSKLDRESIVNELKPEKEAFKQGCNSKHNIVVATGYKLSLQKGAIELLEISIKENQKENTNIEDSIEDLVIDMGEKTTIKKEVNTHMANIEQFKSSSNDELNDDDLWNDMINM